MKLNCNKKERKTANLRIDRQRRRRGVRNEVKAIASKKTTHRSYSCLNALRSAL